MSKEWIRVTVPKVSREDVRDGKHRDDELDAIAARANSALVGQFGTGMLGKCLDPHFNPAAMQDADRCRIDSETADVGEPTFTTSEGFSGSGGARNMPIKYIKRCLDEVTAEAIAMAIRAHDLDRDIRERAERERGQ